MGNLGSEKSPSGRPSNQYVWDEKCIRLLQRMAASGLDVASLPPKPVMPKCWHRDSEGPRVEIATEQLGHVVGAIELGDDIEIELEVDRRPAKERKIHRSPEVKQLFFSLHQQLHHKSMAEVR